MATGDRGVRVHDVLAVQHVVEVDQCEAAVELVHADLEDADEPEAAHARQRPGRRHRALRRDQHDAVADLQPERTCELVAEHDAELAGHEVLQRPLAHVPADVGHLVLERRIDAAHDDAAVDVAHRQHALPEHVGRCTLHARVLARRRRDRLPHRKLRQAADLDVRGDREDARAQLLLESVHHRQHDDQRRDAERDARHRDQRDERDEAVAARSLAGARIAKADGQFVR